MNTASAPLLSVVLPTYNSAAVLEGALASLAAQRFTDFEVVLSDGASHDDTLAIARRFATRLPALHLHSRPDSGVYDAINRGVLASRGTWFLVLGSDDRLHAPYTLAQAAPALLAADGSVELLHGDVRMMAANHHGVAAGGRYGGPMPLARLLRENLCQQAIFHRRSAFDALGGFDTRYALYADWHFNLRAAFRHELQWIDLVVADYAATGLSGQQQDSRFLADMAALVAAELQARPHDRRLWPQQRVLLRHADHARRQGRWRDAAASLAAYIRLRLQRHRRPRAQPGRG